MRTFGPFSFESYFVIYILIALVTMFQYRTKEKYVAKTIKRWYWFSVISITYLPFQWIPFEGTTPIPISNPAYRSAYYSIIPFQSIITMINNERLTLDFVVNILMFVPLGYVIYNDKNESYNLKRIISTILKYSIIVELFQFTNSVIFMRPLRVASIDDILLNVIGGIMGYLLFNVYLKHIKNNNLVVLKSTTD